MTRLFTLLTFLLLISPLSAAAQQDSVEMPATLPVLETDRLAPLSANYRSSLTLMGEERTVDLFRTFTDTTFAGRRVWRAVERVQVPSGVTADTFYLDPQTLAPIARRSTSGPAYVSVDYSDSLITGEMRAGQRQMPIRAKVAGPVFPDGGALDWIIASMPMTEELDARYRLFDMQQQWTRPFRVRVVDDQQEITVPAGTFDTIVLDIEPLDDMDYNGGTVYVRRDAPRVVVKTKKLLPQAVGGGEVITELESLEE